MRRQKSSIAPDPKNKPNVDACDEVMQTLRKEQYEIAIAASVNLQERALTAGLRQGKLPPPSFSPSSKAERRRVAEASYEAEKKYQAERQAARQKMLYDCPTLRPASPPPEAPAHTQMGRTGRTNPTAPRRTLYRLPTDMPTLAVEHLVDSPDTDEKDRFWADAPNHVTKPKVMKMLEDLSNKLSDTKRALEICRKDTDMIGITARDCAYAMNSMLSFYVLLRDRIVLSPHSVATANVTSACIWDKSRLIAAKTLVSTGVGKLTYIATYEMYGAYARQTAYLCREEEKFLEPFFEILLSLERFSSKYSDTLQKCYGTSMWDAPDDQKPTNPCLVLECKCIPQLCSITDEHTNTLTCGSRKYAQQLLLEIRLQMAIRSLEELAVIKMTEQPNSTDTPEKSLQSSKRDRRSKTLKSTGNDENTSPTASKTLQEDPEQGFITDDPSSTPDATPIPTTPLYEEEVIITTSQEEQHSLNSDSVEDDVIIVEKATPPSKEPKEHTLTSVLKKYAYNNTRFSDLLDVVEERHQSDCTKQANTVDLLWKAMENASKVELSVSNTLVDLNESTKQYTGLAKDHATTLNTLVATFSKFETEERKAYDAMGGLQKLVNTVNCKLDKMQEEVKTLNANFKTWEKDVLFIKHSIEAGDTKARRGLKNVDFSQVPSSIKGDTNPPEVIVTEDAGTVDHAADTPSAPPQSQKTKYAKVEVTTPCLLCNSMAHLIQGCDKYGTSSERKARAVELSICQHCALVNALDPLGGHTDCTAAGIQCSHCKDELSVESTLHHRAFCAFFSKKMEKKNENKRKMAESETAKQAHSPSKRPSKPHSGGSRDGAAGSSGSLKGDRSKRGYARGNGKGRGRGGRGTR
ncbi:unnamed protein product [Caenorhabditis brenneri]